METEPTTSADTVFIYGLVDPRDGRVRYIGQSCHPQRRLKEHLAAALRSKQRGPLLSWLRQLHHRHQVQPELRILEVCGQADALVVERRWIEQTSETEPLLLNRVGNPQFVHVGQGWSSRKVRRSSLVPGTLAYTMAKAADTTENT